MDIRILYVIVLYKVKLEQTLTYQTLLSSTSTDDIYVYDNSPMVQTTDIKVGQYIHDTNNSGLSVAYNKAAEYAKDNGYNWLLLLDQDTTFPKDALMYYKKAIVENPGIHMIVPKHKISTGLYISPTKYKNFISEEQSEVLDGMVSFDDACPINSGIMVDTESFFKAGGYDESVYLDFSDISFIRRYKKNYSRFFVLNDIICIQHFSALENDQKKVFARYRLWIDCSKNLKFDNFIEYIGFKVYVLRRTFYYFRKYKNIDFLKLL